MIMDYKFKFKFWVEVRNTLLHILVGGVVAHTFIPYLSLWLILLILFALGVGREIWQNLRGKIQPIWISTVDALSFGLGGYIWWCLLSLRSK